MQLPRVGTCCVLMGFRRTPYTYKNTQCGHIATLLYRLHYASPSWRGMTYSADDRLKMERFINKLRRLGYLPANRAAMETMIDVTDRGLLRAVVTRNNHVLLSLFPPILAIQYRPSLILGLGPITSNPQKKITLISFREFYINANFSFLMDCGLSFITVKRMYYVITFHF